MEGVGKRRAGTRQKHNVRERKRGGTAGGVVVRATQWPRHRRLTGDTVKGECAHAHIEAHSPLPAAKETLCMCITNKAISATPPLSSAKPSCTPLRRVNTATYEQQGSATRFKWVPRRRTSVPTARDAGAAQQSSQSSLHPTPVHTPARSEFSSASLAGPRAGCTPT